MTNQRDPVEAASGGTRDLYDIATWENRSLLDHVASFVYFVLSLISRAVVVILAAVILLAQFVTIAFRIVQQSTGLFVPVFVLFSVIPAFAIAAYIWKSDVTTREPWWVLLLTYLLGVLFASFAAVLNTTLQPVFNAIPFFGLIIFFYLVVAPIEETVKWLAVRVFAYKRFNAVIDGAVYGAVAGLGFATIENTLYISQQYLNTGSHGINLIGVTAGTAALRTFAGPGHVIYTAFSGYYLGLAKFNPENRGPIIIKGLLIAAFIHATYNTLVTYLPPLIIATTSLTDAATPAIFVVLVIVYDGFFGYLLYRKISRYRVAYHDAQADRGSFTFDSFDD